MRLMQGRGERRSIPGAGPQLVLCFCAGRVEAYLQNGIPMAEALARTSMDPGHGDGRGRWVKMVYLR